MDKLRSSANQMDASNNKDLLKSLISITTNFREGLDTPNFKTQLAFVLEKIFVSGLKVYDQKVRARF